jgi:hypothetical protein
MLYMNESLQSFILIRVDDPDPIKEMHKHTMALQTNYVTVTFAVVKDTVVLPIHTVSHPRTRIFKL